MTDSFVSPVRVGAAEAGQPGVLLPRSLALLLGPGLTATYDPDVVSTDGDGANITGAVRVTLVPGAGGPLVAAFVVDRADWAGLGSAVTHDYTIALPAGARLMGSAVGEGWTGFDDPTHAAITYKIGSSAGGSDVGAPTDIQATSASGTFPQNTFALANFMGASFSGATLTLRVTATVAHLSTFTIGRVLVKVPYFIPT